MKSAPIRTCVGCGARREKAALVRLVVVGAVAVVDAAGRAQGRGAYVCGPRCADKALRRKGLGRAFRRAVSAGPELVEEVARAAGVPSAGGIAVDRAKGKI